MSERPAPVLPALEEPRLADKEARLRRALAGLGSVIVAFSGGTDSAYLAWVATDVLGDRAQCLTADSASYPSRHREIAAAPGARLPSPPRVHRDQRDGRSELPRERAGPLLLLQAGAVHEADGAGARARHRGRARRRQRRRPRRLPARAQGRARARRAQPARRGGPDQGRDPRAVAARRAADVGPARVGVPVVAHPVPLRSDAREARDDRAGRGRARRPGLPRVPRAPSRRPGARGGGPRRDGPRARPRRARRARPRPEGGSATAS